MGLFSGLKKAVKGVFKSVKKVFKSALGAVGKALQNKWVRGALLVCSLVVPVMGMATAGWSAAAGQGIAAQAAGALSNVASGVASMVVNAVTTPIKLLAEGGSNVASFFNAEGLATTLGNAAKTLDGTATSIFGNIKTDNLSQIMGKMGLGGEASVAGNAAAGGIDNVASSLAPTEAPALATAANASAGVDNIAASLTPAATTTAGAAVPTLAQAAAPAAKTGLLDRTLGFINKNPELAKMGFQAVQAAVTPDPYEEHRKILEKQRIENDKGWNAFDAGTAETSQAAGQYGAAYRDKFAPVDYTERAKAAREYINNPYKSALLTRPAV